MGFLSCSVVKILSVMQETHLEAGLILGLGRSHGGGHGNPLQYSCLEKLKDKEPGGLQSMGSQNQT